jgi:hypothetical protein
MTVFPEVASHIHHVLQIQEALLLLVNKSDPKQSDSFIKMPNDF